MLWQPGHLQWTFKYIASKTGSLSYTMANTGKFHIKMKILLEKRPSNRRLLANPENLDFPKVKIVQKMVNKTL